MELRRAGRRHGARPLGATTALRRWESPNIGAAAAQPATGEPDPVHTLKPLELGQGVLWAQKLDVHTDLKLLQDMCPEPGGRRRGNAASTPAKAALRSSGRPMEPASTPSGSGRPPHWSGSAITCTCRPSQSGRRARPRPPTISVGLLPSPSTWADDGQQVDALGSSRGLSSPERSRHDLVRGRGLTQEMDARAVDGFHPGVSDVQSSRFPGSTSGMWRP